MNTNKGFTLIELMITILVFSVIIAAVYASHISQQRTYHAQDQVAEMQQNLRAAFSLMTSDIRMAGYDPLGTASAGISSALAGRFHLTTDIDEDGSISGAQENIDFGFSQANDGDGDGIPDGAPNPVSIGKQNGAGNYQPIADNIQAVEFLYLNSAGTATAVNIEIRFIQITLLARADKSDRAFTNGMTYTTPSGQTWGPYNDNFRRRMLTKTIRCRNLGIL